MAGKYQSLEDLLVNQAAQQHAQNISNQKIANMRNQGERDALSDYLKMAQLQSLQEERQDRAIERGAKAIQESGVTPVTEAYKRLESATPGAASGQAQFKSVGGLKSLIPNLAVPAAEWAGVLPKGAGQERAALQEMANVKVYDASGKQINEAEMRRIQDAMGMRGIFEPQVLQDALKQMGYSVVQKAKTAEAGIRPSAKETIRSRGGASSQALESLLKGNKQQNVDNPLEGMTQEQIDAAYQAFQNSKKKK